MVLSFEGRVGQISALDLRLYMWLAQQMGAHAPMFSPGIARENRHACKRDTKVHSIEAIKTC